ncbi:FecR family protein [Massilibacteroides sp.]|uniref:FecR family protein n=1 Tax=Massilibacteroides sp. TaxID=2034766 RepID=UPI0026218A87|nr:FecR family protein [Massilibacteroides sp.]MDD4516306.1 FecR family protein [Massilibacteroides sp.]
MKDKRKKIVYYWENCDPVGNEEITNSIRNKTLRKIEAESNLSPLPENKKSQKRILRTAIISIAASAAILVAAVLSFNLLSKDTSFEEMIVSTEYLSTTENDQVTLVMSDLKTIHISSETQIAYSPDGSFKIGSEKPINQEETNFSAEKIYNRLIVPKGKRSELILSDGTKIWVNSGTKVIFPTVFKQDKREIYVDGEVYMEVAHNAKKPFYVNTEGFDIKVLGTAFNVFAYKENNAREVALVNGKVEITDGNNKSIEMIPNELVLFEKDNIIMKESVKAEDYKAWVNKILILNGEKLSAILNRLSLMYNTKINCDPSLSEEELYGKFDLNNNIEEVIDYLKIMLPISSYKENGTFYLQRNNI